MRVAPIKEVREVILKLKDKDGQVSIEQVAKEMGLLKDTDRYTLGQRLVYMHKTGEAQRVDIGVYRYIGLPEKDPEARDRIWTILRARRVVSYDDLQELAECSKRVVESFMFLLKKFGYVRRLQGRHGRFQLIRLDVVERPMLHFNKETQEGE